MLKAIFSGVLMVASFSAASAHAQGMDLTKCGQMIGYRPGGSSVIEARYAFNAQLDILLNSCAVQKKLPNSKDNNYYIHSFSENAGTAVLVYEVVTFANPAQPLNSTCTLTQTLSYAPVELPKDGSPVSLGDAMQETVTQTCTTPAPEN